MRKTLWHSLLTRIYYYSIFSFLHYNLKNWKENRNLHEFYCFNSNNFYINQFAHQRLWFVAGVFIDSPTDFFVDTRGLPSTDDSKVTCTITNPSGTQTENLITPLLDGMYKVSYTPFEEGRHTIDIFYDNVPVPGSPFTVNVRRGCDAKKVKAFGPGLNNGFVDKSNIFTVETKGDNEIYEISLSDFQTIEYKFS